jgi:hypothetical protein
MVYHNHRGGHEILVRRTLHKVFSEESPPVVPLPQQEKPYFVFNFFITRCSSFFDLTGLTEQERK